VPEPGARRKAGGGATTAECGTAPPETTPEHAAERVRVLEKAVEEYVGRVEGDPGAMPEEIRRNMANALAFHAEDVHDILGLNGDFSDEGLSTRPNGVDVDRAAMTDFIRGVPEDGGALRTVHDSQPVLVVSDVQDLGEEDFEEGSDEAEGVPW
jgi:hypothetical protein